MNRIFVNCIFVFSSSQIALRDAQKLADQETFVDKEPDVPVCHAQQRTRTSFDGLEQASIDSDEQERFLEQREKARKRLFVETVEDA